MDRVITIRRTSDKTGKGSEIILRDKVGSKIAFAPKIVKNPNDSSKSVSGDLIYVKDEFDRFDEIVISPSKVQKGYHYKITMSTGEVKKLYDHLGCLYEIDPEAYQRSIQYTCLDINHQDILNYFDKSPTRLENVIVEKDSLDVIRESERILKALANDDCILNNLMESDGALENIRYLSQMKSIQILCNEIENSLDNSDEGYWQKEVLERNTWVLSQIFAEPMIVLEGNKAFLGGKDISNKGGKEVDFAYTNVITNHIAFVEIKTPMTALVGREYRNGVYPLSREMSGALSQVMSYKKTFIEDSIYLKHRSRNHDFNSVNPKTFIIAGQISDLTEKQLESFELQRRELRDTIIITFDELLARVRSLIEVLEPEDVLDDLF